MTLNAPLDFTDPRSGKSFRMFQSTMSEAFEPQQFGIKLGEPVYVSGLSLNDDPGRGVTYVGCLMIVAGIFVAYFVRFAPGKNELERPMHGHGRCTPRISSQPYSILAMPSIEDHA